MEIAGILLTILFSFLLIFVGLVALVVNKQKEKKNIDSSLRMSVFAIKMPKYEKREDKPQDYKSAVAVMEQIYSGFAYLKDENAFSRLFSPGPRITLEIASEIGGTDICFYISVPNNFQSTLEKIVQGAYPGASIFKVSQDYTIFEPNCKVAASYLKLQNDNYLPLNTYNNLPSDPLSSITNSLSKIKSQEGAAIQIVLEPSPYDLRARGKKAIQSLLNPMQEGASQAPQQTASSQFVNIFSSSQVTNLTNQQGQKYNPNDPNDPNNPFRFKKEPDRILIDAVENKIKKNAYSVNIRLVAAAEDSQRAKNILQDLEGSFTQFLSAHNGFKFVPVKLGRSLGDFAYNFSFRNFDKKQAMVLTVEELSSIYHLPLAHMESPNIQWVKTKESAPPADLPQQGDVLIGHATYRGEEKEAYFASEEDRRRHFYIVGQTGTGKSSLLFEMIRQDIANGKGVGVIDPHGDLIEKVLAIIPKERIEDVVLFEPSDVERPVGLNMLEWETPEQKDFVVSEMISIFAKLFPPEVIGPMFEHYMRNAMLALIADKENIGTLVEIPRIFTDEDFMESKLEAVSDPLVRSFWLREWKQTTGQTKSDMLGYVVSKVGRFVENEMMRNIIGQSKSGFDLSEVMDNGKIFLANLSKGKTGEMNSSLLGLILVSKMQVAAMQRAKLSQDQRKDFYLYIDEFHNFTTDNIATILSEARKYRLNLILAHQYIPQLQDAIRNAVFGNTGTIASFRIGATDAEYLEKQFEPSFSRYDLVNLDNFNFVIKMMINNQTSQPFKAKTIKPIDGNFKIVEPIKKISKLKYGKAKFAVEQEIAQRWNF